MNAHDQRLDRRGNLRQESDRSQQLNSPPVDPNSPSMAIDSPQAVAPDNQALPSGLSGDVVWFNTLVSELGPIGSPSWQRAVSELASADTRMQRLTIDLVPEMPDQKQQQRGIRLVAEAAGQERDRVLRDWQSNDDLRPQVLRVAIALSPPGKWNECGLSKPSNPGNDKRYVRHWLPTIAAWRRSLWSSWRFGRCGETQCDRWHQTFPRHG